MKQNHRNLFILLALVSAVMLLLESTLYYSAQGLNWIEALYGGIHNCANAFALDPELFAGDIYEQMLSSGASLAMERCALYLVALYLAPLCSAAVLFELIRVVIGKRLVHGKDYVVIFGYNPRTEALIQQKPKDTVFCICTDQELEKQQLLALHKQKCVVYHDDYSQDAYKQLCAHMPNKWFQRTKRILLMEENEMDNFSLYMSLTQGIEESDSAADCLKVLHVAIHQPETVTLIQNDHDNAKPDKNQNQPVNCGHDTHILNLELLRALTLLKEKPLVSPSIWEKPDASPSDLDIHVLIVGYTPFTSQLIRCILNQGVVSAQNKIIIDIVACNTTGGQLDFQSQFHSTMSKGKNYGSGLDGSLEINFHDIQDPVSPDFLTQRCQEAPFTYVAMCTQDICQNMKWALSLSRWMDESGKEDCYNDVPIVVKTHTNAEISNYVSRSEHQLQRLYALPSDQDILTLDAICDAQVETDQVSANDWYNHLYYCFSRDEGARPPEKHKAWQDLSYEKKESSRFSAYHSPCKIQYLKWLMGDDYESKLRQSIANAIGEENLTRMLSAQPTVAVDYDTVVDKIRADTCLFQLLAMEHRRWSYFSLTQGWCYQLTKNAKRRNTPYLVTFDVLCETRPDVAPLDLLSYIALLGDASKEDGASL